MSTVSKKQRSPARQQETKSARKTQPHQQPEPTIPAPPRAKVQERSVATWTHQDRQEAPSFLVSDLLWKAQRRVRREMPLERVPWPFRGRTVTEADVRSQGAGLPYPPVVQECTLCGVNVYCQSHFKGSVHVAKTKAARDGRRQQPSTLSAPPAPLPDQDLAALCRERILAGSDFATLVGPVLPVATAAAPTADDETRADLLIDLGEKFIYLINLLSPDNLPPYATPRPTDVAALKVRLSTFWPNNPRVCFAQVDAIFDLRHIPAEISRLRHFLCNLLTDVALEVADVMAASLNDAWCQRLKQSIFEKHVIHEAMPALASPETRVHVRRNLPLRPNFLHPPYMGYDRKLGMQEICSRQTVVFQ
ncbi:hypothetical protein HPB52_004621 [Rhipicephalus sanguineus]|uniref:DUF7041 domain-containing protein n=1 Tax=Rhipicephalus sanguineus TaxID=34632 RepID=A0A9D4Q9M5_RHISA|nr:hypothetical protein HPB52_004621 [Rhipicephalus sanguineus]